jgi:putative transposase
VLNFKGAHFEKEIILTRVRWYVAYPLSYRQLEERMQEGSVAKINSSMRRGWACSVYAASPNS